MALEKKSPCGICLGSIKLEDSNWSDHECCLQFTHTSCIKEWLKSGKNPDLNCPYCRCPIKVVLGEDGYTISVDEKRALSKRVPTPPPREPTSSSRESSQSRDDIVQILERFRELIDTLNIDVSILFIEES
jgi:hypothetical protein